MTRYDLVTITNSKPDSIKENTNTSITLGMNDTNISVTNFFNSLIYTPTTESDLTNLIYKNHKGHIINNRRGAI